MVWRSAAVISLGADGQYLDADVRPWRRPTTPILAEPEGGYRVLLFPMERPTTDLTPKIDKIADVLAEWRMAERRLVDLDPASDIGRRIAAEIEQLREQYRVLFHRSRGSA